MSNRVELERWTRQVRIDTHHEMNRLHHRQTELNLTSTVTFGQRAQRWFDDIRQATQQGWPAIERLVVHLINPKVTTERLLPDASLHRL